MPQVKRNRRKKSSPVKAEAKPTRVKAEHASSKAKTARVQRLQKRATVLAQEIALSRAKARKMREQRAAKAMAKNRQHGVDVQAATAKRTNQAKTNFFHLTSEARKLFYSVRKHLRQATTKDEYAVALEQELGIERDAVIVQRKNRKNREETIEERVQLLVQAFDRSYRVEFEYNGQTYAVTPNKRPALLVSKTKGIGKNLIDSNTDRIKAVLSAINKGIALYNKQKQTVGRRENRKKAKKAEAISGGQDALNNGSALETAHTGLLKLRSEKNKKIDEAKLAGTKTRIAKNVLKLVNMLEKLDSRDVGVSDEHRSKIADLNRKYPYESVLEDESGAIAKAEEAAYTLSEKKAAYVQLRTSVKRDKLNKRLAAQSSKKPVAKRLKPVVKTEPGTKERKNEEAERAAIAKEETRAREAARLQREADEKAEEAQRAAFKAQEAQKAVTRSQKAAQKKKSAKATKPTRRSPRLKQGK